MRARRPCAQRSGRSSTHIPIARSDTDDIFAAGNRCCYCWTMRWSEADGSEGVSHGTDIFTLRDGKISYKKTYE